MVDSRHRAFESLTAGRAGCSSAQLFVRQKDGKEAKKQHAAAQAVAQPDAETHDPHDHRRWADGVR
jgi:hypothetical protein